MASGNQIVSVACPKGNHFFQNFASPVYLLPQRASLKRASKAADPNFVLWVEIKIFYLPHCMTVPVNFNRGAARSGIRQTGN